MIPGLNADDAYRMVEDEFLAVAHTFTVHFHAAEYHRLMAVMRERQADPTFETTRPVVGRMDKLKTRRHAASQRLATRRAGLSAVAKSSSQNRPRSSLQGLMESPHKPLPSLAAFAPVTGKTRASAGFGISPKSANPPSSSSRAADPSHRRLLATPSPRRSQAHRFRRDVLEDGHPATDTGDSSDDTDDNDLDAPLGPPPSRIHLTHSVIPTDLPSQSGRKRGPPPPPLELATAKSRLAVPQTIRPSSLLRRQEENDSTDEGRDADTATATRHSSRSSALNIGARALAECNATSSADDGDSDPFTRRMRRRRLERANQRSDAGPAGKSASPAKRVLDVIPAFL